MKRAELQLTQLGWAILVAIVILVAMGTASIYVTDTHYVRGNDGPANAAKQCARLLVSAVVGLLVLRIGYQRISRYAYGIFFVILVLLVPLVLSKLLHTTFGGLTAPRNGAYRWLHLPGFPLQPSELMKVAYVLALAWYLRYRNNYRRLGGLMLPVALSIVPLTLILIEPDLGTALLMLPVLLAMLFMAGARVRHLLIVVLIGVAGMPFAWRMIKGYQRARVTAVLLQSDRLRRAVINHPEALALLASRRQAIEWAAASGYQLVHSKNAIGSGGLLGLGWGNGVYVQNALLPDRHNDFVFALIGHQWGLVGCLLVLGCYVVIVLAGIRIASATADPLGRLLAIGVVTLIATQVVINVGMTLGLMPITGMTLPFVSYGGSSLLTNFVAVALLVGVSRDRPYLLAVKPFEFAGEGRKRMHPLEQEWAESGSRHSVRAPYTRERDRGEAAGIGSVKRMR
jgi:cell division protein FtsW (lipid II flippase)